MFYDISSPSPSIWIIISDKTVFDALINGKNVYEFATYTIPFLQCRQCAKWTLNLLLWHNLTHAIREKDKGIFLLGFLLVSSLLCSEQLKFSQSIYAGLSHAMFYIYIIFFLWDGGLHISNKYIHISVCRTWHLLISCSFLLRIRFNCSLLLNICYLTNWSNEKIFLFRQNLFDHSMSTFFYQERALLYIY